MHLVHVRFDNHHKQYTYLAPMYKAGDNKAYVDSPYSGKVWTTIMRAVPISLDEYRNHLKCGLWKTILMSKNTQAEEEERKRWDREEEIKLLLRHILQGMNSLTKLSTLDPARAKDIWNMIKNSND